MSCDECGDVVASVRFVESKARCCNACEACVPSDAKRAALINRMAEAYGMPVSLLAERRFDIHAAVMWARRNGFDSAPLEAGELFPKGTSHTALFDLMVWGGF